MLLNRQNLKFVLVLSIASSLFFCTRLYAVRARAGKASGPSYACERLRGSDCRAAKRQLENILANLQLRSGINFTVVTVKTTGGSDIYDFFVRAGPRLGCRFAHQREQESAVGCLR